MINPSATGWIEKFFIEQKTSRHTIDQSEQAFYLSTRATGFIFGHIINFDTTPPIPISGSLPEEVSKIGMLNTLFKMYCVTQHDSDKNSFISHAISF